MTLLNYLNYLNWGMTSFQILQIIQGGHYIYAWRDFQYFQYFKGVIIYMSCEDLLSVGLSWLIDEQSLALSVADCAMSHKSHNLKNGAQMCNYVPFWHRYCDRGLARGGAPEVARA